MHSHWDSLTPIANTTPIRCSTANSYCWPIAMGWPTDSPMGWPTDSPTDSHSGLQKHFQMLIR